MIIKNNTNLNDRSQKNDIYNILDNNPYFIYEFLKIKKIKNEKLIIEISDKKQNLIFVKRFINSKYQEALFIGYYLMFISENELNIKTFKNFINILENYCEKYTNDNYKMIDPYIVANKFSPDVIKFVENYNIFQERKKLNLIFDK